MMKDLLIYLVLAASGWGSYLAFAPYHKVYFAILAVCIFIIAIKFAKSYRHALFSASVFGFFWFFGQLSWIKHSFTVVNLDFLALPTFIAFCFGLSFFMWIPAYACFRYKQKPLLLLLAFSLGWSLSELLRSYILTGFPWNLIGQVWALPLLQATAYVGILGLGLITILLFTSIICCKPRITMILWVFVAGFWYFQTENLKEKTELTNTHMRLIQPSILQKDKWDPELFDQHMRMQIKLSNLDWHKDFDAIIWPEAAVPGFFAPDSNVLKSIAKETLRYHPHDCVWITGVPTFTNDILRNSLLITNKDYTFKTLYHKVKLVPFGEFMPLRSFLPISKMTFGTIDYTRGDNSHILQTKKLPPFAILICYEAIFPHLIKRNDDSPKWILNITNDGWFGDSIGPWQHLQMARTRAIEMGLPMVRAANDGVSAVFDHKGRVVFQLEKDKVGFIDFDLPKAGPQTLVTKIGGLKIYFALFSFFLLGFFIYKRYLRNQVH